LTGRQRREWSARRNVTPQDYDFIPARFFDNPIYAADKNSQKTLLALLTNLKRAFFDGNWEVFAGQYFDRAMGRIGLVWWRMKLFHADIMLLAVNCFWRNRPNDVEVTALGAGAAFESKWIRQRDLKGHLFSYPETDERYPTLWSQQHAVLLQLLANPDPQMQAILAHPENSALLERLIGLEEFVIPEEESRTKRYREIAQLVAEMLVVHRQDVTAAASPGGVEAEVILPSIMPDEFADNHAVKLEICMRWFSSDAGQVAKIEVPLGYMNVRAHALFHRDFLRKQTTAAVALPTPPQVNTGRAR
jgi:hypothetical protein